MGRLRAHPRLCVPGRRGPGPDPLRVLGLARDTDGDGVDDLLLNSGDDGSTASLFRGPVEGELDLADPSARFMGTDSIGAMLGPGDLNGDGWGDLVLSSPEAGEPHGEVWLFDGTVEGEVDASSAFAHLVRGSSGEGHFAGYSLAMGEVDGDGVLDLYVEGPNTGHGGPGDGGWIHRGPLLGEQNLEMADTTVVLSDDDEISSCSLFLDQDGDGRDDLVLVSYVGEGAAFGSGQVWIFSAFPEGDLGLADATATLVGTEEGAGLGYSLASAGDMDRDGTEDLLVGAPRESRIRAWDGVTRLYHGPLSGTLGPTDGDAAWLGGHTGDQAGWSVSAMHEEGSLLLAIGAPGSDVGGVDGGGVYLASGGVGW